VIKLLHVLAIGGLIGSAGYAYSIKYETLYHAEQVAKLKTRIQKERDAIAVIKAEWQLLNRPDRLQEIADRHLDLQPMSVHQLARLAELPPRAPREDEIGRKLEALGLFESTTPRDKRPADARTPTTPSSRTPSR
jgi:hypothetical protein